jgi:hypothetical protein
MSDLCFGVICTLDSNAESTTAVPQVYRNTLERTKSAADKIRGHKLTQSALSKTVDQLAALQVTAAKASEAVARQIDAAVAAVQAEIGANQDGAGSVAGADTSPAAAAAAAAAGEAGNGMNDQTEPLSNKRGLATESFDDAGEKAEAVAAAAAGDIVDVALLAPGRLLYVKPVDENVAEEKQKFELVDGGGGEQAGPRAPLHPCQLAL